MNLSDQHSHQDQEKKVAPPVGEEVAPQAERGLAPLRLREARLERQLRARGLRQLADQAVRQPVQSFRRAQDLNNLGGCGEFQVQGLGLYAGD